MWLFLDVLYVAPQRLIKFRAIIFLQARGVLTPNTPTSYCLG